MSSNYVITSPLEIEGGEVITDSGDLKLDPAGNIRADKDIIPVSDGIISIGADANRFLKTWADSSQAGNVNTASNTISTTNTNGNLSLLPNGIGSVVVNNIDCNGGAIDGTPVGGSSRSIGYFTTAIGGNIQISGNEISTPGSGNINLVPGGTGKVTISNGDITGSAIGTSIINSTSIGAINPSTGAFTTVNATSVTGTTLAAGELRLNGQTLSSTSGNINILPAGANSVVINKVDINGGVIDGTPIGATTPSTGDFTLLDVDNVRTDGNTISTTNTNGNLNIIPDGNGSVVMGGQNVLPELSIGFLGSSTRRWVLEAFSGQFGLVQIAVGAPTSTITTASGDLTITAAGNNVVFGKRIIGTGLAMGTNTAPWGGIFTNTPVTVVSDLRSKKDIVDLDKGLDSILNLRPVTYQYDRAQTLNSKRQIGFIAQEVEEIIPDAIRKPSDYVMPTDIDDEEHAEELKNRDYDQRGINTDALVPVLVNAIKEMNERINEMTDRIKVLEDFLIL